MTRTHVITGGASGIGAAAVSELANLGHRTISVDRHGTDVNADLSTPEGRERMVARVAELTGGVLAAVLACAGTVQQGRSDVQVNVFGAVATLRGAPSDACRRHRPASRRGFLCCRARRCSSGACSG